MRLLFEIGMEEIPARFLKQALRDLKSNLIAKFNEERIKFAVIITYGTPRRLILDVEGLAEKQDDLDSLNLGPAKSVAYNENGEISKAGLGFAKSQGLEISDLEIISTPKGDYIGVRKFISGRNTKELLPQILKNLILELTFPKSMKWSDKKLKFARPIEWFLALCDNEIVEFEIEGIKSSNRTKGHRFFGNEFQVRTIEEYFDKIIENNVVIDIEKRKELVKTSIETLCQGEKEKVLIENDLLDEVTNLVEYPYPIIGSFNSDFLDVPQDVLIISMEVHQRYFPILNDKGKLLPKFVVIRNGIENSDEVRKGNEKVLSARLADARFFYQEDLKNPLENNVGKLKTVVFQKDLGTIYEKIERMTKIGEYLVWKLSCEESKDDVLRTIYLAKADLVSNMVGEKEFTKLQGFIGADYALKSNESEKVAKGIEEHYYPRFQGDQYPDGIEGIITGIADRTDTLVGCFGVGVIPSGSKDPFALRRAALGIVNVILNSKLDLSIKDLVNVSLDTLENAKVLKRDREAVLSEVLEFFCQRAINIFTEMQYSKDVINSVLSLSCDNIMDDKERVNTLDIFAKSNEFKEFLPVYRRVENISKDFAGDLVIENHFEREIERDLWSYTKSLEEKINTLIAKKEYVGYFNEIVKSKEVINKYFEEVMVNVENEMIKNNRLSQLKKLSNIFNVVGNLNLIEER